MVVSLFRRSRSTSLSLALFGLSTMLTPLTHAETITVFAAASLNNALSDIGKAFEASHPGDKVNYSFASSSLLAKQIEQGAPAAVFVSADQQWMDYLQNKNLIDAKSRTNLLANTLVLISPSTAPMRTVALAPAAPWAKSFQGHLCMGTPDSVPAGIYGKQALTKLGLWPDLQSHVVATQDVRASLSFVERGECDLGVVYKTDAEISKAVHILAEFPATAHDPIIYPAALLPTNSKTATAFLNYLGSPDAQAIFRRYGFSPAH